MAGQIVYILVTQTNSLINRTKGHTVLALGGDEILIDEGRGGGEKERKEGEKERERERIDRDLRGKKEGENE